MGEIGVGIAIVAGVILGMVLLNKLLEYLFYRFTIIYNVVLIVIAVASNLLALLGAAEVYVGLQVLFFYLLWTRCDPSEYETVETDVRVSGDSVHASTSLQSHYRPGWWVKLIAVAICTVAAMVLSGALESPILTMVFEIILPGMVIIRCLRRR